ncbi:MAG: hypothetical protein ACE369_15460 [Roseovarius sp.]
MNLTYATFLACLFSTGATHAQSEAQYQKSCLTLVQEMEQYYEGRDVRGDFDTTAGDPASLIVNDFLSELEGDMYLRVASPFEQAFTRTCLQSEDARQDETITVATAIAEVMDIYGLDRAAPRWGLVEIPELDVYVHSAKDIQQAIDQLSADAFRNPMNDPLLLALIRYFRKYDLGTREAQEAAGRIAIGLSYEASDKPMAIVLDRIAAEEGLRLK